ncbi:immunoglobulin-like domain-containing protein [Romboutsia hominis]|uniref:Internalin-A n=2 Tax=Romboutsia hominis TaxID=1507512 RepID=A0A2P2BNK7_9FIRM|nr:immunoglobulin-like domain-containing protein [Romboutsia hominis]MCH1959375.1 DUF5011 domain-containing protein [Romboutsia hominis]CEI71969.1 Internalin-A [Romboutsia hominis]
MSKKNNIKKTFVLVITTTVTIQSMMVNVLADEIESSNKDTTGIGLNKEEHLDPISIDKKNEPSTEISNTESIDTKNEIKDNNLKIENKPIVNSDAKSVDEKVKESKIIDIKDINLKRAINKQLRKKDLDADISKSELESLKRLTVIDSKISDLEGLQYCVNLTYLYLDGDQINDISPIKNLSKLTILHLTNNQISDISPISKLTNLVTLNLARNQISDISPVLNLTNLADLDLANNRISDISYVSNLTKLTNLSTFDLTNNQISDISPISNLTNLVTLRLTENQISDISPLSKLTNLNYLYLNHNQISDIAPLSNLTKLHGLHLSYNHISDISSIGGLTKLAGLYLSDNEINDINSLENLTNLDFLNLNNNQISDITPLSNLTKLTILHLANNQISDINILERLSKLIILDLADNKISDISPIANLNKLIFLKLNNDQISNITPLASLNHLNYLQLDNQNIKLKSKKVKQLGSIEIDDIIVDEKGNKIEPSNISENGLYNKDTNKILWKDINVNSENYSFSKNVNIGKCNAEFSGNVIQPIELIVNKAPTINAENKTIKVGEKFNPLTGVTANDKEDGNITDKIKVVEDTVNTNKVGTYTVKYEVTDNEGATATKTITVTVKSNDKPVITGVDNISIREGTEFDPMAGVTATDTEDGNITKDIKITGNVDVNKPGKYELIYTVTDSDRNTTTVKRVIIVNPKMVEINAVPTINAENRIINVGEKFNPLTGVTANDKEDGNITDKIKVVEDTVNTNKIGTYTVKYEVTDSKGATATKTITVTVKSNDKPVITGADNVSIREGTEFDPMAGVTATDTEDGNITKDIKITGNVDVNKPGKYELIYTVTDSDGNTTTVKRIVTVLLDSIKNDTNNNQTENKSESNESSVSSNSIVSANKPSSLHQPNKIEINDNFNPQTGDTGSLGYIALVLVALLGLVVNKIKKNKA